MKKILIFVTLLLIYILSFMSFVFGQNAVIEVMQDKYEARLNDIINVKINLRNADKVKGINLKFLFNSEIFECIDCSYGQITKSFKSYIKNVDNVNGSLEFLGIIENPGDIRINNSEVFSLNLKIIKEVNVNEIFDLQIDDHFTPLSNSEALAVPADILNAQILLKPLETEGITPDKFQLYQNYPNPFNPLTKIKFEIPHQAKVKLAIYNILGQEIICLIEKDFTAGVYQFKWDGTNKTGIKVASGIYLYRLKSQSFTKAKKLVFIK